MLREQSVKISIGYIHGGTLENEFVASLFNFLAHDSNNRRVVDGKVIKIRGAYLDDNRNEVVREFMERDHDYLLFLDTDHTFPPELIYALIDTAADHSFPICSALYFGELKEKALQPVWFQPQVDGEGLRVMDSFQMGLVHPVSAVGMGCCLIRRDVLEVVGKAHADDAWPWFGRDQYTYKGRKYAYGEDMCFCVRAGKLGFQTWGHAGLVLGHIKKWTIDFAMVQALLAHDPSLGKVSSPFEVKL
jgi:GT2 family glycosyltransferase